LKTSDLERADITVLRLTNDEVFGDLEHLVNKLRRAYGDANQKRRSAIQAAVAAEKARERRKRGMRW